MVPSPHGIADLRQAILADDHRGRTIRWRAETRADGRAALYLRIVTPESSGRDHVLEQPTSADWTYREITTHVPADAVSILFGVTLAGIGDVALRNAHVESVHPEAPR